jgi:glycosyltransferase involved in cell wall biosynthesis
MSEFETHPLVALEAAAARRRLLVADRGGLAELAGDGFARQIPLDSSPAELAGAVIEELARPLPEASPRLTSWDECAAALLGLYGEVLQSGHTSKAEPVG